MGKTCPACRHENPPDTDYCGKCAASLKAREDAVVSFTKTIDTTGGELTTGSTFAERYRIIEELGRGGMGRVYKAIDTSIDEKIAIKIIKPEIACDGKAVERFGNELKIARKIGHRNVGRMYHLERHENIHYITMEYVSGEDLKSMIRMSGQLGIGTAVSIARQICEGLGEAHRSGIVHRDLKPSNIMIDREGRARILDFGIASSLKTKGLTGVGVMIGTPEYMSPEQVEAKEVDRRSDIYSLGVILYEMLTGEVPFSGDTPFAVGIKQKAEIPEDPRRQNARISENLSRLILKCLEKDKADRYQTSEEVCAELGRIEQEFPTGEKPPLKSKSFTSKEFTVRFDLKKLLIPAGLALALLVVILALIRIIPGKAPPAADRIENSVAVIGFENHTGDAAYDYLGKAIPSLLITNLEQSGALYVATRERLRDLLKQMGRQDVEAIDRDLGLELCRREGIESIVMGSFVKAGEMFATDVKVLDVESLRMIKSAGCRGEGIDSILRTQIDDLSREIIRGIGIRSEKGESPPTHITEVTTTSMEAYEHFLRGRDALDKMYYEDARLELERALAIDPEFASAHLYHGRALGFLGNRGERDTAYAKAEQYAEKATEKERLYISAQYARAIERDDEKKVRLLRELIAKYPREKRAHYQLGLHFHTRHMYSEALAEYNASLRLDPGYGIVLNDLAYIHAELEDYPQAIAYFEKYASVSPGDANPVDSMAELYFRMGQWDEALAKYRDALDIMPSFSSSRAISYIHALREEYDEALRWIRIFSERAVSLGIRAQGLLWEAIYRFLLGQRREAFRSLDNAEGMAREAGNPFRAATIHFMRGWFYYEMEVFDKSREHIQVLTDHLIENNPKSPFFSMAADIHNVLIEARGGDADSAEVRLKNIGLNLAELNPRQSVEFSIRRAWAEAELLMRQGLAKRAAALLEETPRLSMPTMGIDVITPHNLPLSKDLLARAFRQAGELDRAIAEYERLIILDPDSDQRHLILPVYHLRLGRLYEEKGMGRKALEQYRIFLDLWKDADPGLPEVEEARRRLAGLK